MASEQAGEEKDPEFQRLVELERAAEEARVAVTVDAYTPEGWSPWVDAAAAFQAAVTAYTEAGEGRSRYEVEMAAKRAARHAPGSAE